MTCDSIGFRRKPCQVDTFGLESAARVACYAAMATRQLRAPFGKRCATERSQLPAGAALAAASHRQVQQATLGGRWDGAAAPSSFSSFGRRRRRQDCTCFARSKFVRAGKGQAKNHLTSRECTCVSLKTSPQTILLQSACIPVRQRQTLTNQS